MSEQTNIIYEFGPFRLDTAEHLLLCRGLPVRLKPKVYDLLLLFIENNGHILQKERLMEQVWADNFVEESNLTVSVFALRKALEKGSHGKTYIETVPRVGYRFVGTVNKVWEQARSDTWEQEPPEIDVETGLEGKSIAVLPFKTIGAKSGNDYLGLGIADILITRLSNVREILVRPTSAVHKYVGTMIDPVRAGRELKVKSVLEGSIQQSGERIRLTVQLVDVHSGTTLWAEKFDENFTDIFAVEDLISEQITRALMLELHGGERKLLTKRNTENTEAYRALLKARYFLGERTKEGFQKGIKYFERAIEIDPNYALAYIGIAECYIILDTYDVFATEKRFLLKAKEATLRALKIDDTFAEAHATLAHLETREWNWDSAEREFTHALELNPNYATAHQWYAVYLRMRGRLDEATTEIKRAQALDPLSLTVNSAVGLHLFLTRQYEPAIEQLNKTLELKPDFTLAHFYKGIVYDQMGRYEEALEEYRKTISFLGETPELITYLGRTYALSGEIQRAQEILAELHQLSTQRYIPPYYLALLYVCLGAIDEAFAWLEKGLQMHDEHLSLLQIDPRLDSLRRDRRFISLLTRIGLNFYQDV